MKELALILITLCSIGCKPVDENLKMQFLEKVIPDNTPVAFKQHLSPSGKLIHKGIFSPDLEEYYYTISDTSFEQFDIYLIKKLNDHWTEPEKAFFNSQYSEHGMSFSADGLSVYFSSTRPTNLENTSETWHIWKSENVDGVWTSPTYIDIPNMRDKLTSHPIITNSGKLYFHASNLDYSEMDIYHSQISNGEYQDAIKVEIAQKPNSGACTPYISPKEDYIIFASIGNQLDLWISFNDGQGNWIKTKALSEKINTSGQGNPYVTPDDQFLFFTVGEHQKENWRVKWVNIKSEIEKDR